MQIFYKPGIHENFIRLDSTESHHCINVLRMKSRDEVAVINGKGIFYRTKISKPDSRECVLEIIDFTEDYDKRNYRLHIAIAPTKSPERFEWFLEKSVEIGIDEITPLICRHSTRTNLRKDRLEKIIVSAVKQSLKATIPILNDPENFADFISRNQNSDNYIAVCSEIYQEHLIGFDHSKNNIIVLIGPEGDFSESEITSAIQANYRPVSLGKSRLRTETAGIAVTQIIADYYVFKDSRK